MSFGEQQFENPPVLPTEKLEDIKGIDSVEETKIPKGEKSTKVGDVLKYEQIMKELKNSQEVNPKTKKDSGEIATGRKPEFRETLVNMERNDIIVGESYAKVAEDLLNEADINFEVKRFTEAEPLSDLKATATVPGEFLFRLNKNDDESADKAFAILRQAKLECTIIKEIIDLDKDDESGDRKIEH